MWNVWFCISLYFTRTMSQNLDLKTGTKPASVDLLKLSCETKWVHFLCLLQLMLTSMCSSKTQRRNSTGNLPWNPWGDNFCAGIQNYTFTGFYVYNNSSCSQHAFKMFRKFSVTYGWVPKAGIKQGLAQLLEIVMLMSSDVVCSVQETV